MIESIVIGILFTTCLVIFLFKHGEKKKKEAYVEMLRTHARAQERMRENLLHSRREREQREMRGRIDEDRIRRGLPPLYGPDGIRVRMRDEAGWDVEPSWRDVLIERADEEGDPIGRPTRINSVQVDVRQSEELDMVRRQLFAPQERRVVHERPEKVDFLTEDDMVIE